MMKRLNSESGVAALTVLMVTSVLAVAGTVVITASTAELQIGARDRRSEEAFAGAEAGLDVASSHFLKNPTFVAGETEKCLNNPLVPPEAGIECEVKLTSPTNGRLFYPATGRPFIEYTVVSKAKEASNVTRTIAETYRLQTADVPYGFFIDGDADFGGTTDVYREAMLVNGNVTSRDKVNFDFNGLNGQNDDPDLGWRFHGHRIQSDPAPRTCQDPSGVSVGCAGVYSNFQIYEKNLLVLSREIHNDSANPDAAAQAYKADRDVHQTKVVGGQAQPIVTLPTNSVLEMMDILKPIAEQQALYFNYKNGASQTITIQPGDLNTTTRDFEQNVVVYIDADQGDTIKWKVSLVPNDTLSDGTSFPSDIKYINDTGQRVGSLSGILVVRNGSLEMESNTKWSGALFAPENGFKFRGGNDCVCTVYSKGFSSSGGNSRVQLTPDWFAWLPTGFVTVVRTGFFECEPFQTYPAGRPCAGA